MPQSSPSGGQVDTGPPIGPQVPQQGLGGVANGPQGTTTQTPASPPISDEDAHLASAYAFAIALLATLLSLGIDQFFESREASRKATDLTVPEVHAPLPPVPNWLGPVKTFLFAAIVASIVECILKGVSAPLTLGIALVSLLGYLGFPILAERLLEEPTGMLFEAVNDHEAVKRERNSLAGCIVASLASEGDEMYMLVDKNTDRERKVRIASRETTGAKTQLRGMYRDLFKPQYKAINKVGLGILASTLAMWVVFWFGLSFIKK